ANRGTEGLTIRAEGRSIPMRRVSTVLTATALLLLTGRAVPGEVKTGLDEEGFITTWLLLAPIPLEKGQSGADCLGKEQIPGEARLRPATRSRSAARNWCGRCIRERATSSTSTIYWGRGTRIA